MTRAVVFNNVSGMTNNALLPTNPNTKEATMANTPNTTTILAEELSFGVVLAPYGEGSMVRKIDWVSDHLMLVTFSNGGRNHFRPSQKVEVFI